METAVIFLSTDSLQKGDRNPTYSDCSLIAKNLNKIIINGKKELPLSSETGMFYTDKDDNLDKYCAVDVLSLAPCQGGVFAVLKVKEMNKDTKTKLS